MSRAVNDILEAPQFDPEAAFLLIYRNECDEYGDEKWHVACYATEDELIQDLIENKGPAFAAIHMRLGLVGEVRQ